jgi:hypothetical protein
MSFKRNFHKSRIIGSFAAPARTCHLDAQPRAPALHYGRGARLSGGVINKSLTDHWEILARNVIALAPSGDLILRPAQP